jgi:hypothetical protein
MPRGIVALVFRCKLTGGQLAANDEVTAFRWAGAGVMIRPYASRCRDATDRLACWRDL